MAQTFNEAELLEQVDGVARHADPAADVREILLAFARFFIENPDQYRLLSLPRSPDARPVASAERARALIEGPLAKLAEQGARDRQNELLQETN